MSEPKTKEEYEARSLENFKTSGQGIEGVKSHFACPFCAAPDWYIVRVIDFGPPQEPGTYRTEPIECESCGRSAKFVSQREGGGSLTMRIVQTAGPDPAEWVPIAREETEPDG